MTKHRMLAPIVFAFAFMFWFGFDPATSSGGAALAENAPDATFTIFSEQTTSAGTFSGQGTVKYKDEEHKFTIEGMTAQGVDSNHPVDGSVYGLKSLEDLEGVYKLTKHDHENGLDVLHLENDKGVKAIARGSNKGMGLGIKASGIKVTLDK